MAWRQMTESDLDGVIAAANEVHRDLPENDSVFRERLKLFPEGCLVLARGDQVCGYAFSHPIRNGQPPALSTELGEIPHDADQYYIHDLVVLPGSRGRGAAAQCIEKILTIANRYPTCCLVSVYGTGPFWNRFGFVPEPVNGELEQKLLTFGADAAYLVRRNHQNAAAP